MACKQASKDALDFDIQVMQPTDMLSNMPLWKLLVWYFRFLRHALAHLRSDSLVRRLVLLNMMKWNDRVFLLPTTLQSYLESSTPITVPLTNLIEAVLQKDSDNASKATLQLLSNKKGPGIIGRALPAGEHSSCLLGGGKPRSVFLGSSWQPSSLLGHSGPQSLLLRSRPTIQQPAAVVSSKRHSQRPPRSSLHVKTSFHLI